MPLIISSYSFRLPQRCPLAAQPSLHLCDSEWLWHLHCQHTSAAIPAITFDRSEQTGIMWGCVKQAAVFNLQTASLVFWSRTIPAYITSLQPGIGSSHAMASAGARGHNGAQSDPQSAQWWEFTLSVRCQVELFQALKEKSIVCESPVHCHTRFFCPEQILDKKAHKVIWCSTSKVEM